MTATATAMSPLKTIRQKCLDCAGNRQSVKNCPFTRCSLYPYRFGKNPYRGQVKPDGYRSPLKAIRAECLDCNGSSEEVRRCTATNCALHPLRFGKNPNPSAAKKADGVAKANYLKMGSSDCILARSG